MSPPRLLVSAGPSREYLDEVRFLSNASSGRMGIAVAAAAADRGWAVHLALGPTTHEVPLGAALPEFVSARDLDAIACELWPDVDAFVATAAVCDYRPAERLPGKRKKSGHDWDLRLVRNPDVLAGRAAEKGERVLVGFALEATLDRSEARRKLEEKRLDLILLNTTANLGTRAGSYLWMDHEGEERELPDAGKDQVAAAIVEYLAGRCQGREIR